MNGGVDDAAPGGEWSADGPGHVLYERGDVAGFVDEWLDARGDRDAFDAPVNALVVTASMPVDDWVGTVRGRPGFAAHGLVSVGEGVRSTAATGTVTTPVPNAPLGFAAVPSTDDLPAVGRAVDEFLDGWRDGGARTVVCLDALPAFLDHAEDVRFLRFLAALLSWLDEADATAHAVVDPAAVDAPALAHIESLFDVTVAVNGRDDDDA